MCYLQVMKTAQLLTMHAVWIINQSNWYKLVQFNHLLLVIKNNV